MSLEENKAVVRRWFEATNKQNLAVLGELIAPDFYHHTTQLRREAFKQYLTMLFKGFPDWHLTIEDIIAEGDKVWIRFDITGTHKGEYRGLASTGKKITAKSVNIYRIVNGKVVEVWRVSDLLDFYRQLGVIEYTEKAKEFFPEVVS